jgi:hypothetical protein
VLRQTVCYLRRRTGHRCIRGIFLRVILVGMQEHRTEIIQLQTKMRIRKIIRQVVLFSALVTFLAVTTGAAMAIHLSLEHHGKHDSRHCHTCHQLFAINTNCMVAEHIFIADYARFCDSVSFHIRTVNSISSNDSAEARAPPLQHFA